jgi:hypothetical protein
MAGDAVLVDRRNRTLSLPYSAALANLVKDHRVEKDRIVVPHTHDVVKLARNLGLKAPAAIMAQ